MVIFLLQKRFHRHSFEGMVYLSADKTDSQLQLMFFNVFPVPSGQISSGIISALKKIH